ncbi:MAG: HD domain-containing protein [Myxococcaceae bacterium]|nr:HD domain-containing protein [Myxococcaceae bacterium]
MKLFRQLLLLMLVASAIPTALVAWTSIRDTRELLVRDAQELAQERVKQLALKIRTLLDEPTRAAVGLGRLPGFFELPRARQQTHLASLLTQRRELTAVTLFDAHGERIPGLQAFALRDIPPSELAEHESRARALLPTSEVRYSEVSWSASRHEPVITVAFPMGDPIQGFGAAEISLRELAEVLAREKVGSSGFAYVVDARGRLVAKNAAALQSDRSGVDLSQRPAVAHFVRTLRDSPQAETFHVGAFGEGPNRIVGAYAVLPQPGWAAVSEQPIELAYSQVKSMERRSLLVLATAVLVALGLAAAFSRNVTRPLRTLTAGALELARGKLGHQVDVKQKNELGELSKTFNYMSAQLSAYDQETRRLYEGLEQGYLDTIVALANAIDSKDAYTRGHSQRVGEVAVEIGREMGLTERELKWLKYGGILHDVGKIGIVESILCKQSRLTEDEMLVMRGHPEIGDQMVAPISFLEPVRAAIRSHHERWDGTGYPDRLKGKEIPLIARIVNCADTFDACTSTRPYQKAMPLDQAMEVMERLRGAQLDPEVLDALRRVVEKKGVRIEGQRKPVKLAS